MFEQKIVSANIYVSIIRLHETCIQVVKSKVDAEGTSEKFDRDGTNKRPRQSTILFPKFHLNLQFSAFLITSESNFEICCIK